MPFWLSRRVNRTTPRLARAAYRDVFDSEKGHIVLTDLAQACHLMETHGGDPFLEGQRSLMLYILKVLRTPADVLQEMADRELLQPDPEHQEPRWGDE